MNSLRRLCLAFITISALSLAPSAKALDFTFELTNTGESGIPGTLTGTVFGLTEGPSSSATDIVITGIPFDLGTAMGITPDYSLFGNGWAIGTNDFSVSGGVVTAVSLNLAGPDDNTFTLLEGDEFLFGNASGAYVLTDPELPLLNFTQVEAVPEPSTYAFGFLSVLALVYAWRRNSIRA